MCAGLPSTTATSRMRSRSATTAEPCGWTTPRRRCVTWQWRTGARRGNHHHRRLVGALMNLRDPDVVSQVFRERNLHRGRGLIGIDKLQARGRQLVSQPAADFVKVGTAEGRPVGDLQAPPRPAGDGRDLCAPVALRAQPVGGQRPALQHDSRRRPARRPAARRMRSRSESMPKRDARIINRCRLQMPWHPAPSLGVSADGIWTAVGGPPAATAQFCGC